MVRQCMRPGCDRPVAARLTYDPVGRAVWLDPAYGEGDPVQQVCEDHAGRLTAPLGWTVTDRRPEPVLENTFPTRGGGAPPKAEPQKPPEQPAAKADVPPNGSGRRTSGRPKERPEGAGLLKRAFDWTGPQHSVLTSPSSPDAAGEDTSDSSN